jgi:protoporphyrinogen oxidase
VVTRKKCELEAKKQVVVIGAGPAGLTAAYLLSKAGKSVTVLEADPKYVGGISKTVEYQGFRFDIGGHRFFSKSQEVEAFWTEILGKDLLDRPRSSRIFYNGKYFSYPLKPLEALLKLGVVEAVRCGVSYLRSRIAPRPHVKNFEDWVSNRFGYRLFSIFFKTYTEKVWGMSCQEISSDWAAQRIKGLSLTSMVLNALRRRPREKKQFVKTLIDTFRYPRKGPGMMWEVCAEKTKQLGGEILLGCRVTQLQWNAVSEEWTINYQNFDGKTNSIQAQHVISSAPLREVARSLAPELPPAVLRAADGLRYRDFLMVALMGKDRKVFQDNWIYIHDPGVKVGRIQNFKSWSPEMVPYSDRGCLGLEYFCFENDDLWKMPDADLIALAKAELAKLGLANSLEVTEGYVVRQKKAYPIYDEHYRNNVAVLAKLLEKRFPTLALVGRNGMHKYNNQDHSMMTAMLCVENILAGTKKFDLWQVNEDAQYHEAGQAGATATLGTGLRLVPQKLSASAPPTKIPVDEAA